MEKDAVEDYGVWCRELPVYKYMDGRVECVSQANLALRRLGEKRVID